MPASLEQEQLDKCPICSSSIKTWRVKNVGNEQKYPNSTINARRIIGTIKALIKRGGNNRLLDVGCGYGFFSKEALASDFEVVAIEMAENERSIAKEITGLDPILCSFEEFEYAQGSLSAILMSQTLEHALDVNLWIRKSYNLQMNGGILAIALPNYGSIFQMIMQGKDPYICPPEHLNYFNPHSLSMLLENHGYKVETIQWVSRQPRSSFEKHLPKFTKPLLPVIEAFSSFACGIIDAIHLGMMINVYARKTGQ